MNHNPEIFKGRIIGLFMIITVVNLLGDDGEPERAEADVKIRVVDLVWLINSAKPILQGN